MKRIPLLTVIAAALCLSGASVQAEPIPTLLGIQVEHEKAMAKVEAEYTDSVAKLQASYDGALEKLQSAKQASGDLDATIAVKKERDAAKTKPLSAAELAALPREIADLRKKFDKALLKLSAKAGAEEITLLEKQAKHLLVLQEELTKGGELEKAIEARDLRKAAIARAKEIENSPAAVAASRQRPPGARPEPGPGPQPDPPETQPLSPTDGKLTLVATRVQGKGKVEGAVPSVIPFDGPTGDGRRGAKGILVKALSDGSGEGSTWAMEYKRARSARGLQIIHPRGKGHAIVHITKGGVSISTPGEWRKVGYVGRGEGATIRGKKAFDDIFPLAEDKYYSIVSRMAANGSCEVFVNGQLVITANVRSADPLDLTIPEGERFPRSSTWDKLAFKGEGLPMLWEKNWAGVIVEPLDSGVNVATNLRYSHGIAEVPTDE